MTTLDAFETDTFPISAGNLEITFLGHGSLFMTFNGKIIHVDPFGKVAGYSTLPKADLVLATHEHFDHFDPQALAAIRTDNTALVYTAACAQNIKGGSVMHNGDALTIIGLKIEAVPAYNLVHKREDGHPFHPKGAGNGYILSFGDTRLYIAGDTENIPEMKTLQNIAIAFLPMNLPYTMTPEMVADAATAFQPRILYPYHYGKTDTGKLVELLKNEPHIELRVRKMA